MSIVSAIIGTAFSSTGGGGGGGGGTGVNDFTLYSDDPAHGFGGMSYWWNSSLTGGGAYIPSILSSPPPAWNSYVYPDSSNGHVYEFTGSQYLISANLTQVAGTFPANTITIDYWFYPTANGIQLLTEQNDGTANPSWHYSVLEINTSNNILAKFWDGAYLTSGNTVNLNQWNHIWFTEDSQGGHSFELNGVPTNGNPNYVRTLPGTEYFSIGYYDVTNMGNTGRFQGKVGLLKISDFVAASTFTSTKSRFGIV